MGHLVMDLCELPSRHRDHVCWYLIYLATLIWLMRLISMNLILPLRDRQVRMGSLCVVVGWRWRPLMSSSGECAFAPGMAAVGTLYGEYHTFLLTFAGYCNWSTFLFQLIQYSSNRDGFGIGHDSSPMDVVFDHCSAVSCWTVCNKVSHKQVTSYYFPANNHRLGRWTKMVVLGTHLPSVQ